MSNLKNIYEQHLSFARPDWAQDDRLGAWQEDLIETAAYIAGLASTKLGGSSVTIKPEFVAELRERLEKISGLSTDDQRIYEYCSAVLSSLEKLTSAIVEND